jgi:hypothetical protein
VILNEERFCSQECSFVNDEVVLVTVKHVICINLNQCAFLLISISNNQCHKTETQTDIFVTKDPVMISFIKFKSIRWCEFISIFRIFTVETIDFIAFHCCSLFTKCNSLEGGIFCISTGIFFISYNISMTLCIEDLLSCIWAISCIYFLVSIDIPHDKAIKTLGLSNSNWNLIHFGTGSN